MDLELQAAIEVLEHGRQTHVDWIEYLKENPDVDTDLVGDIEHHEWYLTGYDPAIKALRLVANLDPTVWDDMLAEAFYGESFMDLEEERQWVREFEYELLTALGPTAR